MSRNNREASSEFDSSLDSAKKANSRDLILELGVPGSVRSSRQPSDIIWGRAEPATVSDMLLVRADAKEERDPVKAIRDVAEKQLELLFPGKDNKDFRAKMMGAFDAHAKKHEAALKAIDTRYNRDSEKTPKSAELERLDSVMRFFKAAVANNISEKDADRGKFNDKKPLTSAQSADKAAYDEFPEPTKRVTADNLKKIDEARDLVRKSKTSSLSTEETTRLDELRRLKVSRKLYQ